MRKEDDLLRLHIEALRALTRTSQPNRVALIERNIDDYLKPSLERLRDAIDREEAERRRGEDWRVAKDYVRSRLIGWRSLTVSREREGISPGPFRVVAFVFISLGFPPRRSHSEGAQTVLAETRIFGNEGEDYAGMHLEEEINIAGSRSKIS